MSLTTMKTIAAFVIIGLIGGWYGSEISAQTAPAKKNATPTRSSAGNKTRARRAVQSTAQKQVEADKSVDSPKPDQAKPETVSSDGIVARPDEASVAASVEGGAKPVEESNQNAKPAEGVATSDTNLTAENRGSTSPDPVATLRDEIESASTAEERIRTQLKLVDHLVATGHRADALAELNLIAKSDVFDPTGFYNVGNSFARLGQTNEAIDAYSKAIDQRKGRYSRAYNNLGVVLLRVGRWDEAQDALLSALKLESFRYAEASYNLGRVYAVRGETDLAVREWRRALRVDPKHDGASQALARVGGDGTIVVEAQPSTTSPVSDKPIVSSSATAVKPSSVKSSSRAESTKALSIDQRSFGFLQLARNASERGKMLEAVDYFRRVIARRGGYFPPANLEISYAFLGLKRYDEALANLLQVSNRDGARYPISHYHLARLYEMKGDLRLAEAAFARAAAAYASSNGQFLLDLSRVREKQKDYKGALEAMEQYVAVLQKQGQKPSWSDERLAALRQKVTVAPK